MKKNQPGMLRGFFLVICLLGCAFASLARAQELPADAPHANVRDFGALGDGIHDDTQAFRDALASTYSAWEVVYVPPGTYLVSDRIDIGRFLTLRGAGPEVTTIRLADDAEGFQDMESPRGVLRAWRGCCEPGGAHDNTTHSVHILNLTVEIGTGTPGAIAIDFIAHNGGGVENVVLRDASSEAHTGLSLERDANGPSLYNRIRIEGFRRGIAIGSGVYGTTFEDIFLIRQSEVGLLNNMHPVAARHLYSENTVPAVKSVSTDYGQLVLLDSLLLGGGDDAAAIESSGSAYLRNVESEGYKSVLEDGVTSLPSPIKEYFSPKLERYGDSPNRSLNLPIKNMYVPELGPPAEWANVRDFGSGDDWTARIQAAIDSGAKTIYFPSTTHAPYPCEGDVIVRGAVRNLIGLYANLGTGRLLFETEDPSAVIYVEQMRTDGGYVHRSPATVVLRRSMGAAFTTESGAGDAMVDDWCCGNFKVNGSSVWSRQLNEESEVTKLDVNAGQLWVLGLKTEQIGTVGHFRDASRSEILGALIYPAQGTPSTPMYLNEDSSFAAFHRQGAAEYPTFSTETHAGVSATVNPDFTQGTLYVSNLSKVGGEATGDSGLRGTGGMSGSGGEGSGGSSSAGGGSGNAGGAGNDRGSVDGSDVQRSDCSCRHLGQPPPSNRATGLLSVLSVALILLRFRERSRRADRFKSRRTIPEGRAVL